MKKLKKIISEYSGVDEDKIDVNTSLARDIGLDSFSMISLVTEIEQIYDISISDQDLASFQTLNDVIEYLRKKSTKFEE